MAMLNNQRVSLVSSPQDEPMKPLEASSGRTIVYFLGTCTEIPSSIIKHSYGKHHF